MKVTPVLLVESIEKSLPFWIERMGWKSVSEVPDGDVLQFVMLVKDEATVMLQTFASARRDEPRFAGEPNQHRTSLFVLVDDWNDTIERLAGYEIVMPERETFYGMREIGVFEPGGHVLVFATPLQGAS